MIEALSPEYDIRIFDIDEPGFFHNLKDNFEIVAFPGGIGDADSYDKFFRRRAANALAEFVERDGRYLGICMGAYWSSDWYFDILDGARAEQYIKRPNTTIRRSYSTVAKVNWKGQEEHMFFYDGCSIVGDESKFKTIARYENGDPMAIIQKNVGIIGCHPESKKYWFEGKRSYIKEYWHEGRHHKILLDFVNELMYNT